MTIDRIRTLVQPASTLVMPDDDGSGGFGISVIRDPNRGHIIIGSPWKSYDYGAGVVWSGGVYVIKTSDGSLAQEILPISVNDQEKSADFGRAIALSGNWLAITTPRRDFFGNTDIGAVYFFEWTGSAYTYRQRLAGNGTALTTDFGESIAMDGSLCVVGDRGADNNGAGSGTIHIFRLSGGIWSEDVAAKTDAPITQDNQYFGHAVDVSGSYIAVSASQFWGDHNDQGRAWVYEDNGLGNALILRDTLLPTTTAIDDDIFGDSIEICGDYCAVGWQAYDPPGGYTNSGRIEVYRRSGTLWPHHQSLDLPETSKTTGAELGYGFGCTGGVSMAGDYLLGGAPRWARDPFPWGGGASFLWKRNSITNLYESISNTDGTLAIYPETNYAEFGASMSITSDGKMAISASWEYGTIPEGEYSYLGTVRLYEIPPPPVSPVASGFLVSASALEEVSVEIEQYMTKMHPVTKRRFTGWKWDEVIWPGEDIENNQDNNEEEDF